MVVVVVCVCGGGGDGEGGGGGGVWYQKKKVNTFFMKKAPSLGPQVWDYEDYCVFTGRSTDTKDPNENV